MTPVMANLEKSQLLVLTRAALNKKKPFGLFSKLLTWQNGPAPFLHSCGYSTGQRR
jgi:hypothetical protein